ncbi:MAG: LemA family protein, partial [Magnetococcales bacterium]|nr:LemA family protein [Magnetococcales bacterium]
SQRRDEYNTDVKLYNTLITTFPWSIMARILGFQRYAYFSARPGPDNMDMDLDSRKFMRLIPEGELNTSHGKEHSRHGAAPTEAGKEDGKRDPNAAAIGKPPTDPTKPSDTLEGTQ